MSQTTTSVETLVKEAVDPSLPAVAPKRKRNRRKKHLVEATSISQPPPSVTLRAPEPIYTIVKSNSAPSEINSVSIFPISSEATTCVGSSTTKQPQPKEGADKQASKSSKKRKNKKKNDLQPLQATTSSAKPACCKIRDQQNELSCFELICPHSSKQQLLTNQQPKLGSPVNCTAANATSGQVTHLSHLHTLSDSIVKKLASLDSTSISITLVNPEREKNISSENSEKRPNDRSSAVSDTEDAMPRKVDRVVSDVKVVKKCEAKDVSNCLSSEKSKCQQKDGLKGTGNSEMRSQQKSAGEQQTSLNEKVDISSKESAVKNGAVVEKTKAQLKAERKAVFEAQRAAELTAQGADGVAGGPEKSKAELRAERRALQEAQRLAKAQNKPQQPQSTKQGSSGEGTKPAAAPADGEPLRTSSAQPVVKDYKGTDQKAKAEPTKKAVKKPAGNAVHKQGDLHILSHLHQNSGTLDHLRIYGLPGSAIHPAVLKVGFQIAKGNVSGSNSRCIAMLHAFRSVIKDYCGQAKKRVSQDMREQLDADIEFLNKCRPLSVSMQNAVAFLKGHLSEVQDSDSTHEVKDNLVLCIDKFIREEINLARKQIAALALTKILDGDVILTYSHSTLVKRVLKNAHERGKKFRVIVVDSRPRLEGREMLRYLTAVGISCTYILINAVSYIMKEVTKVMLGAHSLLANGYVTSRIGSSQIALVARAKNVPVLVCCETYKFSERVHTDSFVSNELGATSQLLSNLPPSVKMDDLRELPSLTLLNLTYDVTPPEFVDMVITEKGMLPCTSVPVVLRMRNAGLP